MTTSDLFLSTTKRPALVIGKSDLDRLSGLIDRSFEHAPVLSSRLLEELERARIVPDDRRPPNVVGMGSEVDFLDEANARERTLRLVYPPDADVSAGRISILTPVGAALLGLSPGQHIDWPMPDGSLRRFRIIAVRR